MLMQVSMTMSLEALKSIVGCLIRHTPRRIVGIFLKTGRPGVLSMVIWHELGPHDCLKVQWRGGAIGSVLPGIIFLLLAGRELREPIKGGALELGLFLLSRRVYDYKDSCNSNDSVSI